MDYDKLIAPAAKAMRPSGIRKFFDLAAEMPVIKGQTFQEIALFVAKRLSPLDDVLSTATHFVLRTYKKEGRLYQDEEIDERECTVL